MDERVIYLDYPIPLSSGIAWFRVPHPMNREEIDHLVKSVDAGLNFLQVAGWVIPETPEVVATVEDGK